MTRILYSVTVPPSVEVRHEKVVAVSGENVTLYCDVDGSMPLTLTWLKGHQVIAEGPSRYCIHIEIISDV